MTTEHIIGYHGTTKDGVESLLTTGTWLRSRNEYDWLGKGVYFFQDSPQHALRFAEKRASKNLAESKTGNAVVPCVARARIALTNCIDLTDSQWAPSVKVAHRRLALDYQKAGRSMPTQRLFNPSAEPNKRMFVRPGEHRGPMREETKHNLDCLVINHFIEDFPTGGWLPHSVRAAFVDGKPLYATSWLYDLAHVQLCVLEPELVIDALEEVPIDDLRAKRAEGNSNAVRSALRGGR